MALSSNGAANSILAQYWDGSSWITSDLPNSSQTVTSDFELKEFDFSNISMANENENFKVRFSFSGTNMTSEEGKSVVFNNIAISAIDKNVLSIENRTTENNLVSIYPNPAKNRIYISSNTIIDEILVYNIFGKIVHKSSKSDNSITLDISDYAKGIYVVKVFTDGNSQTKKIVKK